MGDGQTDLFLAYLTFPDRQAALEFGREAVKKGLAAGVNIVPAATSIYCWQGQLCEKEECVLFAQLALPAFDQFTFLARRMHSYEVPCVIGMPIAAGDLPFLEWIGANGAGEGECGSR